MTNTRVPRMKSCDGTHLSLPSLDPKVLNIDGSSLIPSVSLITLPAKSFTMAITSMQTPGHLD